MSLKMLTLFLLTFLDSHSSVSYDNNSKKDAAAGLAGGSSRVNSLFSARIRLL
jgi:hypothetical protein